MMTKRYLLKDNYTKISLDPLSGLRIFSSLPLNTEGTGKSMTTKLKRKVFFSLSDPTLY